MHQRYPAFSKTKIVIGVPVFNGAKTLPCILDSILAQTFDEFEILLSDNASSDATEQICNEYLKRDCRVHYVRHKISLGAALNFKYILDHVDAPYFMWWADDDFRSRDFLEENIHFLESNIKYAASSSPNCFEGDQYNESKHYTFSLDGDIEHRFRTWFCCFKRSHGLFYSVLRTNVIKKCPYLSESFIGWDWAIVLYMARQGRMHRTTNGIAVFGLQGVSTRSNFYKAFRKHPIEILFPFLRYSQIAIKLSSNLTMRLMLETLMHVLRLNLGEFLSLIRGLLANVYYNYVIRKPKIRLRT